MPPLVERGVLVLEVADLVIAPLADPVAAVVAMIDRFADSERGGFFTTAASAAGSRPWGPR